MRGVRAQATTEDIEKVLGRFHAWTGSRTPKIAGDDVREISYEEALASTRYRWRGRDEMQPATNPPPTSQEEKLQAEPAAVPAAPPEREEMTPSPAEKAAEPEFAATAPEIPPVAAPKSPAARAGKVTHGRQQFSSMLAQSAGWGGTSLARTRGGEERQVSMSLRVAASEQLLIKMRAAEAGVSASAYLRQCALEVETLRAHVQFMATSVRNPVNELRDGSSRTNEGWFSRVRRRLWGRSDISLRG
jgi:hypothetical protein